jgi:hypothetical protein
MKYYFKEIDGEIVIKPLNKIRLIIGDVQIFCPSEDILFEQGWEEYSFDTVESVEPELSESEELEVLSELNELSEELPELDELSKLPELSELPDELS